MEHFRLKKYRGPETWARVREAYVAGEPAASVALRFDVSVANLRKKASQEGWTRRRVAEETDIRPTRGAPDPPPPPTPWQPIPLAPSPLPPTASDTADPPSSAQKQGRRVVEADGAALDLDTDEITLADDCLPPSQAVEQAMIRAARLLSQGRGAEAAALLKGIDVLTSMTGVTPPGLADLDRRVLGFDAMDAFMRAIEMRAMELAALLVAAGDMPAHRDHWHAFYLWRAQELGPEVAAADHRRAIEARSAGRPDLWGDDGRLRPLTITDGAQLEALKAFQDVGAWFQRLGTTRGYVR